jgi:hypothetical protein
MTLIFIYKREYLWYSIRGKVLLRIRKIRRNCNIIFDEVIENIFMNVSPVATVGIIITKNENIGFCYTVYSTTHLSSMVLSTVLCDPLLL